MARLLVELLESLGHAVTVVSALRSWEGRGDRAAQRRIELDAGQELERLERSGIPPTLDAVMVYHVYHKAPDWIGLEIVLRYRIPYILIEASHASSRAGGKWAAGYERGMACIRQADAILCLNPADRAGLLGVVQDPGRIHELLPFTRVPVPGSSQPLRDEVSGRFAELSPRNTWLVCVAMMRPGDKLSSYRELAAALGRLEAEHWNLVIVGDGRARDEVEAAFSGVRSRCLLTGQLSASETAFWLQVCDCFVWPAINEAYGLALLEAVACGLPAVAYDYGGVGAIIEQDYNGRLVPRGDRDRFVSDLRDLIRSREIRKTMGNNARKKFRQDHDFVCAGKSMAVLLDSLK